jgi:hypothetical protein
VRRTISAPDSTLAVSVGVTDRPLTAALFQVPGGCPGDIWPRNQGSGELMDGPSEDHDAVLIKATLKPISNPLCLAVAAPCSGKPRYSRHRETTCRATGARRPRRSIDEDHERPGQSRSLCKLRAPGRIVPPGCPLRITRNVGSGAIRPVTRLAPCRPVRYLPLGAQA